MSNLNLKSKEELIEEINELKQKLKEIQTAGAIELSGKNIVSKTREFVELVNENSHDLIFIHSLDGSILGVNKVVAEFIPSGNLANMRDLIAPEVRNKFNEYLLRIQSEGEEKGYMKVIDKNGQRRILKYYNKLVKNEDGSSIIQGLAHDITDLWTANKKLKSSEESYRGLFDSSEDPIFILDENGIILNANITAQETFEAMKYSLIGEPLDKICFKESSYKVIFHKLVKRAWDGQAQRMEWMDGKAEGHEHFREITLRKGKYLSNEVLIAYNRDITERKLAEEKIREEAAEKESEKKLQKVFDHINLFMFNIDSYGIVKYCNSAFCKLTGLKKEHVIDSEFYSLFVADDDIKKINFSQLHGEGSFLKRFELKVQSKYGDQRTIQFNTVKISDSHGVISTISLMGEDITESTRVIRALRDTNKKLQDLFDNANDLIQIFGTDHKFTFVNNAWKNALGYTEDELGQLSFDDIIATDSKRSTLEILDKIMAGEKIDTFDSIFVTKTGKIIYVVGSVNCRFVNDKPVEFRGIFYDNTYKVRAERAQNLYYGIANLAIKSDNLEVLFSEIHILLKKYIDVNNFHVALFEENDTTVLNFPYYVDENFPGIISSTRRQLGKGLTEYSLTLARPVFLYEEDIIELTQHKVIEPLQRIPKIWMGVPLRLENRIIGVIAVKSYSDRNKYRQRHLEMLDFVSGQIAFSIERKRNEVKIQKQSAKLQTIIESSQHLIWSINKRQELSSFNKNYANAIFYHHGTYPQLDTPVVEPRLLLSAEEFRAYINQRYREAFEGKSQHYETYIADKNGDIIWRETYLNPIYSKDGEIEEVSGITHDITEKKKTELAIRQGEEKFRNIFESFQDIYYRTDIEGKITLISPSVNELMGYQPEEMIGHKITDFYINYKKQERFIKELLRTGSVRNFEVDIKKKDGTYIQTISNIRLIYNDNNKPIAIDGVARDITELKKASEELLKAKEVAEKSLKVKELFLANMSHEIRTPMNGIIGMIDLLVDTPLDNEQSDYVFTIKKSSETLLTILNDILDLSKLEAGKMELRYSSVDIRDTVEKIHSLFMQRALVKDLDFVVKIDDNIPQYLIADETRLLQILSNLTSNAIKFTDKGIVSIHVKLLESYKEDKVIKIEVKDSGIGIHKEDIRLLFDSFSQVDNSSTKSFGGTGLGLAISKQLCKLMKGDIGVLSKYGKGSTFWFTFHAESTLEVPIKPDNIAATMAELSFKKSSPYILLVDDNQVNRKVGGEILKKTGCIVDLAINGIEAIEKIKTNKYDLILMDIQMPLMDGIAATKAIRKLKIPDLPPIIAMTAYSMKEDKEKFISAGMDDYISKPIRSESLLRKIKDWISDEPSNTARPTTIEAKVSNEKELAISQLPAINLEIYEQLKQIGGVEMVKSVYEEFEEESIENLKNCTNFINGDEIKEVLSILHSLKGTAGTLGVEKMSKIAAQIEFNLKNGKFETLKIDNISLLDSFEEFRLTYKKLVNS